MCLFISYSITCTENSSNLRGVRTHSHSPSDSYLPYTDFNIHPCTHKFSLSLSLFFFGMHCTCGLADDVSNDGFHATNLWMSFTYFHVLGSCNIDWPICRPNNFSILVQLDERGSQWNYHPHKSFYSLSFFSLPLCLYLSISLSSFRMHAFDAIVPATESLCRVFRAISLSVRTQNEWSILKTFVWSIDFAPMTSFLTYFRASPSVNVYFYPRPRRQNIVQIVIETRITTTQRPRTEIELEHFHCVLRQHHWRHSFTSLNRSVEKMKVFPTWKREMKFRPRFGWRFWDASFMK